MVTVDQVTVDTLRLTIPMRTFHTTLKARERAGHRLTADVSAAPRVWR